MDAFTETIRRKRGRVMYLSTENAHKYLGKTLDSSKRILGAYPYKVIQTPSGEYLAVDRVGVGMVIAEPKDKFNQIYFDIVNGICVEQGDKPQERSE